MRKIKWLLDTGFAGCDHTGEFEVDDSDPEMEIERVVMQEVFDCISYEWWEEESV